MTEQNLTNSINQMISFLDNNSRMSDILYPDFSKPFNPQTNYIKQVSDYLSKYYPEASTHFYVNPNFSNNENISFDDVSLNYGNSWGYGTYFDGESVELSVKERNFLTETQIIMSEFLNATVIIQDDCDVDFNDDLIFNIVISNIELENLFMDDEQKAIMAESAYIEENCYDCGEEIYSCVCS
jgi:hypothetical protein